MPHGDEHIPSEDDLRERAEANEPIIDTPLINMWAELDLPLRGERRENVIQRMRAQLRNRRTVEGISSRLAANLTSPVQNAVNEEMEDRVRGRIQGQIEEQVENSNQRRQE